MHYYIYPKGGNAEYIAWALEFLGARFNSDFSGGFGENFSSVKIAQDAAKRERERERENKSARRDLKADSIESSVIKEADLIKNSIKNADLIESSSLDSIDIKNVDSIDKKLKTRITEISNSTYSFLDDKNIKLALKTHSSNINKQIKNNEAKLLLSAPGILDILLQNLKDYGIIKAFNGVNFTASVLNYYFKEKYKNTKKLVAISIEVFYRDFKQFGNIREILKERGFVLFYILPLNCPYSEHYLDILNKENADFLCADFEFFYEFDFFKLILRMSKLREMPKGVNSLLIYHSQEQLPSVIDNEEYDTLAHELMNITSNYIVLHAKAFENRIYNLLKMDYYNQEISTRARILPLGYASNDNQIKASSEILHTCKRDTIIFMSKASYYSNKNQGDRIKKLIYKSLELGYFVIYKSHPNITNNDEQEREFCEEFISHKNFTLYNKNPRLSNEEFSRAICFVSISSSTAYSFPVISKRPVILLYPKKDEICKEKLEKDDFFQSDLHERLFEDDDDKFSSLVNSLANDELLQEKWRVKITNFCENNLYNYGKASVAIADWICEWFAKREILEDC